MHEQLWEQLEALDKQQTAARTLSRYVEDSDSYLITLLNVEYTVNLAARSITLPAVDSDPAAVNSDPVEANSDSVEAEFLPQLCILAYLINAKDLPLGTELVKGESFPGGMFFFRGGHAMPTQKLADTFGDKPEKLFAAAEHLAGEKAGFGDASVKILVLPSMPVTLVIWGGDDEFDASASILFDKTASEHLALDALLAAVNLMVNSLAQKVTESD